MKPPLIRGRNVPSHPFVLISQHFGSLVFDRKNAAYLPFDHGATRLLRSLIDSPHLQRIAGAEGFVEAFSQRGFFGWDGRFLAETRDLIPPKDHLAGPLVVHLEVAGACDLACVHCFADPLPRHENPLRLHEMDRLFAEMSAIGSMRLGVTGGEPTLRHDLLDLLDAALSHGLHPSLTTNGLSLTEPLCRELGKRPLVWLNVSLDGPDAATNDRIRGAGVFDRVMERLPILAKHARFCLAFTLMSHNAHLAPECAALAERVGAEAAIFRPLYPVGAALRDLSLMPTLAQYKAALGDLRGCVFGPEDRLPYEADEGAAETCGAGRHICAISVQGEVSPCSFLGSAFDTGNIRHRSLREIWDEGEKMRLLRQADAFGGGCRARAQALAGSAHVPDPWMDETFHPGSNLKLRAVPLPMA